MNKEVEHLNNEDNFERQTIIIQESKKETNSLGIAGFILAIVAIVLGCVPILGWILWALGLIFSLIGIFRKPNSFAIAGLIISLIGLIIMIFVLVGVFGYSMLNGI